MRDVRESNASESRYLMDLPEAMISLRITGSANVGEVAPALRGTMMTVALTRESMHVSRQVEEAACGRAKARG